MEGYYVQSLIYFDNKSLRLQIANIITKIDSIVLIMESILALLFIPFALRWIELLLIIQVGMEITSPMGGMKKEMTENNNVHISLLRCVTTIL